MEHFIPPIRVYVPQSAVKVSSLTSTSFTVLVENQNEFADAKLFWMLVPKGTRVDGCFFSCYSEWTQELLGETSTLTPIAKSAPGGEEIAPKSGNTNGLKEIAISTGIASRDRV